MPTGRGPQRTGRPPFPTDRAARGALFWGIVSVTVFTPAVLEIMGPGRPLVVTVAGCGFMVAGILVGFVPVAVDWLNECQLQAQSPWKGEPTRSSPYQAAAGPGLGRLSRPVWQR